MINGGFALYGESMARTKLKSADLDVTTSRVSEIVNSKRAISAETALRLGLFFQMEPRFWLNLLAKYDMRVAERELSAQIAPRIRAFVPVGA